LNAVDQKPVVREDRQQNPDPQRALAINSTRSLLHQYADTIRTIPYYQILLARLATSYETITGHRINSNMYTNEAEELKHMIREIEAMAGLL